MRKIDEQISQDLERVARQEFLKAGFMQANLRSIVNQCGVSTQTVYLRYGSKAGLFDHLVADTAQNFLDLFKALNQPIKDMEALVNHSSQATDQVLDFIYAHFEDFKLIFCCSEGTPYEHYLDQLIQIEEESILTYMESIHLPGSEDLIFFVHKKATEGLNDLYEIVYHDLDRERAVNYMALVKEFRFAGWRALLTRYSP